MLVAVRNARCGDLHRAFFFACPIDSCLRPPYDARLMRDEPTMTAHTLIVLDGIVCLVEEVETTYWGIVVLPEQAQASLVFTPAGAVRMRKISPFTLPERIVAPGELSEFNQVFLRTFADLRTSKGQNHIVRSPNAPPEPARPSATSRRSESDAEQGRPRAAAGSAPTPERIFHLTDRPLDKANEHESGLCKDGNRGARVLTVLRTLGAAGGNVGTITALVVQDGGTIPPDPEKMVRTVLRKLMSEEFGAIVEAK